MYNISFIKSTDGITHHLNTNEWVNELCSTPSEQLFQLHVYHGENMLLLIDDDDNICDRLKPQA